MPLQSGFRPDTQ
jgi:hypothetical protein